MFHNENAYWILTFLTSGQFSSYQGISDTDTKSVWLGCFHP